MSSWGPKDYAAAASLVLMIAALSTAVSHGFKAFTSGGDMASEMEKPVGLENTEKYWSETSSKYGQAMGNIRASLVYTAFGVLFAYAAHRMDAFSKVKQKILSMISYSSQS